MCGIGGIYSYGAQVDSGALSVLWSEMAERGEHACGFAVKWSNDDDLQVVKQQGSSLDNLHQLGNFCASPATQFVMLHTRFTTQGSAENNGNNHPVLGHGMVVTHNGVLYNDDKIFKSLGVQRKHDVDTEAINGALRRKAPKYTIENIQGSMSIAWVDLYNTDIVHLMPNGDNPLVIARLTDNSVVWASCLHMIENAYGSEVKNHFNAMPFKQYTLKPDGKIRSKYISKRRAVPYFGWQYGRYLNASNSSDSKGSVVGGGQKARKDRQNGSISVNMALAGPDPAGDWDEEYEGWAYSDKRGWFYVGDVK